jgi:2-polyprenyl-3-methyl-5-hydroxy-6-metoxy-1,4-benzoquinol methylase
MSVEARVAQTRQAFDAVAELYDGPLGNNEVVQRMRAALLDAVVRHVPAPARLLDLGCGTGIDAVHLAHLGYRVHGIDASPRMVARTRLRAAAEGVDGLVRAEVLAIEELERLAGETFDGVYSDLGALNCVADLRPVGSRCAALLRPEGALVASVIGRVCPWELAYYGARGRLRRAAVRFAAGPVPVPLNGATVWTTYYRPGEFLAAFRGAFTRVETRSLGLFSPPPYLDGFHRRLPGASLALSRLDARLGALPLLRGAGDHFLMVLRHG